MSQQWLIRFQDRTYVVNSHQSESESDLHRIWLTSLSDETGWPLHCLDVVSVAAEWISVRARSQILGGKGGFGTLLKGQSRQRGARITTDFGACRDLQGRRLRSINEEFQLRAWRLAQQQQQLQGKQDNEGDESQDSLNKDYDYLMNTPSGLFNWHLQVPTWANISLKATRQLQRNYKRYFQEIETEAQRSQRERKERDERYRQSASDYVQCAGHASDSLGIADAIQQGFQVHKKAKSSHPTEGKSEEKNAANEDGVEPSFLITLSGDIAVEESSSGWKVQSLSDFGTMALIMEQEPSDTIQLYYEVHLVTVGIHQIGWADLSKFLPNTDTGDGVGDDASSYSFDASRGLLFHAGKEQQCLETKSVHPGDVIGCCYDMSTKTLSYAHNGKELGNSFHLPAILPLSPALSCNEGEIIEIRWKTEQMTYKPPGAVSVDRFFQPTRQTKEPLAEVIHLEHSESHLNTVPSTAIVQSTSTQENAEIIPPSRKINSHTEDKDTHEDHHPYPPLDLNDYDSVDQLIELGLDRLRHALMSLQCKFGGTLQERAHRLYSLKGLSRAEYPLKVRAKHFVV
jgi:Replication stress response SDE2 C-terminal/SPRY domain/Silencing defective 2 N-terminal ubiquitin domain